MRAPSDDRAAAPSLSTVFASAKRTILHKLGDGHIDYSPKGSIDAPIAAFIPRLNAQPELVTTSSCAGRIAIYAHGGDDGGDAAAVSGDAATGGGDGSSSSSNSSKGAGRWLFVSHEQPISVADVLRALHVDAWGGATAVLKVEPLILHVQCRSVGAAQRLMRVAMGAGFRESGIGIGTGGKVIVAVRTTASSLEVPLRVAGRNIVDEAYTRELVAVANARFREVGERRARFMDAFNREYADGSSGGDDTVAPTDAASPNQLPDAAPQAAPASAARTTAAHGGGSSSSSSSSVLCSGCGASFASRNQLFTRHLVPESAAVATAAAEALGLRASDASSGPVDPSALPAPPRRVCPTPRAPLAPPPIAPSPAVAVGASRAVACSGCSTVFPSRNQLHRHIDSCPPAVVRKLAMSSHPGAVEPSARRPGSGDTETRLSPAGAPLLCPSVALTPADVGAAQLATERATAVLSSIARQRARSAAATAAGVESAAQGMRVDDEQLPSRIGIESEGLSIDWERLPASASAGEAAARLARWGHTACVVHRQSGGGAAASLVAVVGGYSGTGIHGRSADVVLFDPATRRVHAAHRATDARGQPAWLAPQPITRHTATVVPWSAIGGAASASSGGGSDAASALDDAGRAAAAQYDPILVIGGNDGPLKPLAEPWWLLVTCVAVAREQPDTGAAGASSRSDAPLFEARWLPAAVAASAQSPAPRWGHTATLAPSSAVAGSPPAVVLCGGRDAHRSFDDVWCAELVVAPSHAAPALPLPLPSLRWHRLKAGVAANSGSHAAPSPTAAPWRGRFYHAAAALDTPLPLAALRSEDVGGTATLVASIAVHGG